MTCDILLVEHVLLARVGFHIGGIRVNNVIFTLRPIISYVGAYALNTFAEAVKLHVSLGETGIFLLHLKGLRCGILNRYEKIPIQTSLGTVVTERVIDLVGFALTVLLGLVLEFNLLKDYLYDALSQKMAVPSLATLAVVGIAVAVLCVVLYRMFRQRLMKIPLFSKMIQMLLGFWQGIKSILYLRKPWLFVLYSVLIYFLYFLSGYVAFWVLPETMHLTMLTALMVYIFGSVGMMITPGGIGLYPALIAETLAIYKVAKPIGYALGWISWGVQQVVTLVLGMGYLVALPLMKKKNSSETDK